MRLVVWNAHKGLDRKSDALSTLAPDIAVIPEAEDNDAWRAIANATSHKFHGEPSKGLLVVACNGWTVEALGADDSAGWVCPVRVDGPHTFDLLAVWTKARSGWPPTYAQQTTVAIDKYRAQLRAGNTVVAGDFNAPDNNERNRARHFRNVDELHGLGLVSAYHVANGAEHGDEPEGTLYWQWRLDQPFHCDFAFIPATWTDGLTAATVGSPHTWVTGKLSDHCPLVVDVATPTGRGGPA